MSNFCLIDNFLLSSPHPQCKMGEDTGKITKFLYVFRDLFKNIPYLSKKKIAPRKEPFHHIVGNG